MNNTFFIADTHFGDDLIINFESRPFSTSEEMDNAMIHNWNLEVKKEDVVFVLGDFSSCNSKKTEIIVQELSGYKILILRNHDSNKDISYWKNVGFEEVYKYPIIYNKFFILSHEPIYMNKNMPYITCIPV